MLEFYQKRSWRTVLHSPVALGLAFLLCFFMAEIVYERYTIEQEMLEKKAEAQEKLDILTARKVELEEKVLYLSNDRGIEAEMRRNFDVARPGEQVVIIVDKEASTTDQPLPKMTTETPRRWYEFWR
jgi:cell division protein FtsB